MTPKASRSVEAFWSFTAIKSGQSLILPDGRCDIILRYNIHRSDRPTPIITGPATRAYTVAYDAGDSWIGMRLRPEQASVLWKKDTCNAADVVLRQKDAIAYMPSLAQLTRENLTQSSFATAAHIAPDKCDTRLTQALDWLHLSGGRLKIALLAHRIGITARHLNRLFRANIGLRTKTYAQLVQFHRSIKLIQRDGLSISDAAFEGGYADHAHLTRAFRQNSGFQPSKMPPDLILPTLFQPVV